MNEILHEISAKVAFSPTCNLRCVYCRGSGSDTTLPASMEDFRRQPLETGSISTEVLLKILQHLHNEGLRQIRPTGGEPMLRRDWDMVVTEAARMGYSNVDITTNGILLENYLENHGSLPEGLSMVKISLDSRVCNMPYISEMRLRKQSKVRKYIYALLLHFFYFFLKQPAPQISKIIN